MSVGNANFRKMLELSGTKEKWDLDIFDEMADRLSPREKEIVAKDPNCLEAKMIGLVRGAENLRIFFSAIKKE